MKPCLPVTTYIDIHLRNIKSRCAVTLSPHVPCSRILKTYPPWIVLVFILGSFSEAQELHGSAVVVAFNSNEMVIAADSRTTDGTGVPSPIPYCKIRRHGHVFFAVTNTLADAKTGYDVYAVIETALRPNIDF